MSMSKNLIKPLVTNIKGKKYGNKKGLKKRG